MALSSDLISQLVKSTRPEKPKTKESTSYGTAVDYEGRTYVKLDGSELLTPVNTTSSIKDGDRVTVMIKNHSATVTGNMSDPSASGAVVKEQGSKISEFEIVIADKVSTKDLEAESARIDKLVADDVIIRNSISANEAKINELIAEDVEITGKLTAAEADIDNLTTNKLDSTVADITYATIKNLEAAKAEIYALEATYGDFEVLTTSRLDVAEADIADLEATRLTAEQANLKYANIDFSNIGKAAIEEFYSKSGLIKDLVVGDGTITGELVGVTIKGDLIEGNTVKADKLVVKGSDGLYYKLNFEAGTFASGEAVPTDSLHGSVITAKSITAEKVSVKDLVAFGATIGGFTIKDHSLYSGVKSSANNTTRGIFLGDDGQVAFGDESNFLRYFKDTDNQYKLEITAASLLLGAGKKSVETELSNVSSTANEAKTTAETANSTANDAKTTAGTANATANEAKTTAGAANTTANEAKNTAETANSTANTANTTANEAKSTASAANTTANEAKSTASTANTTANEAKTTADNAQDTADSASENANTANERVSAAEILIDGIRECISMLVRDENGESLMTQDGDGWTFSMKDTNDKIFAVSSSLDSLQKDVGDTEHTVEILQQSVDEISELNSYVKIKTDGDQPCIELGTGNSDFKLLITNTDIRFKEGSSTPAYINNQSLHISKAVIEEELRQGGYIWKIRSNGNMGLAWGGS